jgi:hypothetical protein
VQLDHPWWDFERVEVQDRSVRGASYRDRITNSIFARGLCSDIIVGSQVVMIFLAFASYKILRKRSGLKLSMFVDVVPSSQCFRQDSTSESA